MSGTKEVIRFDDLKPYLLLQNGNFLYKVPFRDGWAVLKVFYGSRGTWGRLQKSFSNVVLYGQTSYMPKTRCRIERECLDLWGRHGFRVFGVCVVVDGDVCAALRHFDCASLPDAPGGAGNEGHFAGQIYHWVLSS